MWPRLDQIRVVKKTCWIFYSWTILTEYEYSISGHIGSVSTNPRIQNARSLLQSSAAAGWLTPAAHKCPILEKLLLLLMPFGKSTKVDSECERNWPVTGNTYQNLTSFRKQYWWLTGENRNWSLLSPLSSVECHAVPKCSGERTIGLYLSTYNWNMCMHNWIQFWIFEMWSLLATGCTMECMMCMEAE